MFHNNKIRPRITHKANIHQVYGSFIETRGRLRDSAALADDLKNCGRNELISSALKNLSRTTPSARNVIFGNGKPETIEELGTGKNCYFFKPVSVENEINWAIQCLKPYKNLIAAYIQVRDEVEALILKGEFEAADRLLDLSINDFGHSVWYYEMKLTIAGYQEKIDRALELLTEVNTKKKMILLALCALFCIQFLIEVKRKYQHWNLIAFCTRNTREIEQIFRMIDLITSYLG